MASVTCASRSLRRAANACAVRLLATLGPVRDFIERADEGGQDFVLTPRELEVLMLIAEGNTSKEIATMLVISIKTVD
jgi:DNA-binding NarL/FixJ family response regulator